MDDKIRGMVKNGPTPTMFDMFMAVACNKPKLRCNSWCGGSAGDFGADIDAGNMEPEPGSR